jgi:carboxymethylenebutenolidase
MCFDDDSHPPMPLSDGSTARGKNINLLASDGANLMAYTATSGGPVTGQVVILPDVRGLHNFYRELALRFADVGMRAVVFDYFARTAQDNTRDESFQYGPQVEQMTPETFTRDLEAAVTHIRSGEGEGVPTFTVGFCMGGSLSFYSGTRGLGLDGVVGFYAALSRARGAVTPVLGFASQIESPVLGLFGGADEVIPQTEIDQFDKALGQAGVEHEIAVYPGAPHSFFDRKAADFAEASADAWSRVQGFIADHGTIRV